MTKVQTNAEKINIAEFDDSALPTDVHLVTYTEHGNKYIDAVRAYTKVDIFDVYYDRTKGTGNVYSIESGFGRIRPNLYGKIKDKE